MIGTVPKINIKNITDSFSHIQNYVLNQSLTINNYVGTPTYRVIFRYKDRDYVLDKNLIIDMQKIKGKVHISVFLHLPSDIVLLYNDNPVFPANADTKSFEQVSHAFENFTITKEVKENE